ncbi:uncharacterized protein LOC115622007 [Scaptodrosophila lebanonensis]|uniref:Uncharacterized protein LOC115622007 n=1 Tax=Drosophila lebanonensis TaxID=7225 RepID=A0A6J2T9U5_DROLE|nr:uncharacterized protein LOC115622007 [Scaptodrosophila lebanonensis]
MKLVARLPGGTPPEFRRKLWLSLADKYLKSKNVDWTQEREKCFCEEWREDDEELGIQIVKDLHRTGSNLCTGPAGSINQAKLKRILLGYARYNPEVGYCQGFNMLGALILQVMDKEEEESIKVMIYLVEGVLPTGYFCGSMGGLQADMGVFRELMQTKLPRLAKHLQKLQGPIENAYEPPLTNVFTMQWFLTIFCSTLPMSCVLRVWDLVLIEGSDVLLRTALVLWSLLEERVLNARTADDFYGKMGSFSSELLNGHLIDSNGLIEKVVQLGPIEDLRQLRDKHLYNIAPLRHKQGLQLYYDDEDTHSDEESRLAVATVWGLNWGRRGSMGPSVTTGKQQTEQKDRLALDISLLKKQYDRLRERQKQAHVILTTACSTAARQTPPSNAQAAVPVSQLLQGRPAIITNRGKRVGAPPGAIPPARKPSLPAVLHVKPAEKQLRRGETLLWRDADPSKRRRDSLTWKEIKADRAAMLREGVDSTVLKSQKIRSRFGKSDSSSYSEESDGEKQDDDGGSSTDTSLCDDDDPASAKSLEQSPKRKAKLARKLKDAPQKKLQIMESSDSGVERRRPKSWAPTTHEIPFMLMGSDSGDEKEQYAPATTKTEEEDSATESDRFNYKHRLGWSELKYSNAAGDLASSTLEPLHVETDILELPLGITSTSQLSPLPDIAGYLGATTISPLATPKPLYVDSVNLLGSGDVAATASDGQEVDGLIRKRFDVSDDGVTNEYFERVNSVERPTKLALSYSLNEEDRESAECVETKTKLDSERMDEVNISSKSSSLLDQKPQELEPNIIAKVPQIRDNNIPGENKDDYKELLSMTIEPRKPPLPLSNASRKRRDPRRKTLTRSSTIELEERFQALERRLSQDVLPSKEQQQQKQCDKMEPVKHIPSTAALEERYNTLEKQLSAEKQSREAKLCAESNAECLENIDRIPCTADLETRYNALAKQMSSNGSDAKTPIELKDQREQPDSGSSAKKQNDSEKTSKLDKTQEESSDIKQTTVQSESSDSNEAESKKTKEQPRLKKLPSTAELEDRFNALERKMSLQKSSPAKAKKEPPDEEEVRKEDSKKDDEESKTEVNAYPKTSDKTTLRATESVEVMSKQQETHKSNGVEDKITEDNRKQHTTTQKSNEEEKSAEKLEEKSDKSQVQLAEDLVESKGESVKDTGKRKAPPSTEELEKRFQALEKQLSTTNLDSNTETKTSKDLQPKAPEKSVEKQTKNESQPQIEKQSKEAKALKSFEDKCKSINTAIAEDTMKRSESKKEDDAQEEKAADKRQSFEEKCRTANKKIECENEQAPKSDHIVQKAETKDENFTEETQIKSLPKRRASEPPSTEDLEKRYETFKRRMSSRNQFASNSLSQSETVNEALERIEQEVIAEIDETNPDTEDKPHVKKEPPTTEDLENRFEALHSKETANSTKQLIRERSPPQHVDVAIEAHIPEPPPPPPPIQLVHPASSQQRALIEELQSKMQGQSPGEENLRPSDINPQRKRQLQQKQLQHRPTPMGDETSEAPANTAYYRSGNYEPWQAQRMVRRFSDLPSRADLENRLQFLEKQLYKKFYKQRSASDSEVASRTSQNERPSTSRQAEVQLEQRVLALEKQLSENSLKLLEAMREKATAVAVAAPRNDLNGSSRHLSTETIDATGKELVRYTHFGEVMESDAHKPINISINIKMHLNKEGEAKKRTASEEHRPTTEELTRRLEQLEQQLVEERAKNGNAGTECQPVVEETIYPEEIESRHKNEKDSHNESVKSDIPEKLEKVPLQHSLGSDEPETVKETKTLENEEKAQARSKVDEIVSVGTEKSITSDEKTEEKIDDEVEIKEAVKETSKPVDEKPLQDAVQVETNVSEVENASVPKENQLDEKESQKVELDNMIINANDIGNADANNKTVVLLMDNEPKAMKVRRLTRANTEELEDLFQALEKQLSDRNLIKSDNGKLVRANSKQTTENAEQAQAISDLTREIESFTSGEAQENPVEKKETTKEPQAKKVDGIEGVEGVEADYDWGPNPVKHHLKRKTVYLPSTKELEARFRSLERQIKLLEDVEKIDVEQRLNEIERKIKLQYSLSHEKDLNKYLELCEGKGLDDDEPPAEEAPPQRSRSPARKATVKSPYTSPSRKSSTKSPARTPTKSPYTSPSRQQQKTPHTSPARTAADINRSPYTSPSRRQQHSDDLPISDDLEYKYRVLDLVRSKSRENLSKRKLDPNKKPPIHPLEMLLDPSPDDSEIPTTGELEHRIRVLDEKLKSPNSAAVRHKSRSRSPTIDDIKRKKKLEDRRPKTPVHNLERLVSSPTRPEPPTAAELEERMRVLEEEHSFDFKTQKDYREFNQKLKDVVSPSLSFEEFKVAKSREQSPRRGATTPKSAMRRDDDDYDSRPYYRSTSPKVIRFCDEDEEYYEDNIRRSTSRQASERMVGTTNTVLDVIVENTKILQRILKKTLTDQTTNRSYSSSGAAAASSSEGLDQFGSRLMRETSPITRTGTHTGVPLRTGDNINERLSSIKNSIKSIDSLCEEKPYQKEKCQRYIDSLFTDSLHFASKKNSLEDLTHSRSESRGRSTQRTAGGDYAPSIRITSAQGQRAAEHRSLGSAESIRTTSPLRAASPPHYRSHRDISREISPRRRRDDEEREERESSRVRRDNMLPNYFLDQSSDLSSGHSLTKFHKVDRQLEETYNKYADDRRSAARTPLSSPYESTRSTTRYTSNNIYTTTTTATTTNATTSSDVTCPRPRLDIDRPVSPYRPPYDPYQPARSNVPVYQPAKLEIRHTTVTSTFYDRFLTEKQIEKQTLSRPPSRSPVASPSATSKSYSDLPQAAAGLGAYKYTTAPPTTTTSSYSSTMSSSYTGTSLLPSGSSNYSHTSYLTAPTVSVVPGSSSATPSGSSTDLRIRSCDNILMQLGTTSHATTSTLSTTTALDYSSSGLVQASTASTTSAYVPYTFTSSLTNRLSSTSGTTATTTSSPSTSTSALSYSTGVYNPMMSFTLRQPLTSSVLDSSTSTLGQYSSGIGTTASPRTFGDPEKP